MRSTLSTIFTRPYSKWFFSFSFSTKCSEWEIFSWEDQFKTFMEKFSISIHREFYVREINQPTCGKRGFKIMAEVPLIEIDLLINYSRIISYWDGNYLWLNSITLCTFLQHANTILLSPTRFRCGLECTHCIPCRGTVIKRGVLSMTLNCIWW